MTGLSKITDKILDDAKAEAAQKLKAADAECERIRAEYQKKIDEISARANAEAKSEATEILLRAKSSEETTRKNIILKVQGEMIDRAFKTAKDELCNLSDKEKMQLFTDILIWVFSAELEAENTRASVYGEENEGELYYEVMLNEKDRAKLGDELIKNFKRRIVGKDFGDIPARVSLSKNTANIAGGLVVRVGSVEINCSVETLVERLRPQLEAKVVKILFP